ncbi:MAG: hypothetical protein NT150_15320 [Bacteroidetes bacterium]|nr:hypothetical protein [Bacteroidota bacterium]
METKNEIEVKKVWVKPELKVEELNITAVKGTNILEGGPYRT